MISYASGLWVQTALFVLLIVSAVYHYMTANFDYWARRGVPCATAEFFFGSFREWLTLKIHIGGALQQIYNEFKHSRYVGGFSGRSPILIIKDPELVKFVLTKDSQSFLYRGNSPKLKHDFLHNHLFNMEGEEWREMRKKLSPTFTSGKIKHMFSLVEKCAIQLTKEVERMVTKERTEVDCKDLTSRFTTDVIASCAYGLDINSIENRNNQFYKVTQRIFISSRLILYKKTLLSLFPKAFNFFHLKVTDKQVRDYLPGLVKSTVDYREQNNITRNDFLDLLLNIRHNKNNNDESQMFGNGTSTIKDPDKKLGLTLEEIASQTFIFFGAGFETAASTLMFCLYELSRRPDIQQRLREEIVQTLEAAETGGSLTYETIHQMTYMEQVLNETLRRYASVPALSRRCVRATTLPDTDLTVEPGIRVIVPTYALHHDPDYYPDPYTFDPDRFTQENMAARHPYTHLPFGEGPRHCIGMRFGKVQVKVGLAALLPRFSFRLAPGTPEPLPLSPAASLTTPACPVRLVVTPVAVS